MELILDFHYQPTTTDRNQDIFYAFCMGTPETALAARYGLSAEDVTHIIRNYPKPPEMEPEAHEYSGKYDPAAVLEFIKSYQAKNPGETPTYNMIAAALELPNPVTARYLVMALMKAKKIVAKTSRSHRLEVRVYA